MPGWEEKICWNIDGCPTTNACGGENAAGSPRGLCEDDLLRYTCTCATGYMLVSLNGNLTCSPVKCGIPPEINNSVCSQTGQETDYDTPVWTYQCTDRYTLNGLAGSTSMFEASCTSSGAFSAMQECEPVTCGSLQSLDHADASPVVAELLFPHGVVYTCEVGYSVSGLPDDSITVTVACGSDGRQAGRRSASQFPAVCLALNQTPSPSPLRYWLHASLQSAELDTSAVQ